MGAPRTHATDILGRQALAPWLAVLWLPAFELAPNLYLEFHGELAAHSHHSAVADDEHAESRFDPEHHESHHEHGHGEHGHGEHGHGEHGHGDGDHRHADADHHRDDNSRRQGVARGEVASSIDLDQRRHDLRHRGLGALPPPPATPQVATATFVQTFAVPGSPDLRLSRALVEVRARGPPCDPARASSSAV